MAKKKIRIIEALEAFFREAGIITAGNPVGMLWACVV